MATMRLKGENGSWSNVGPTAGVLNRSTTLLAADWGGTAAPYTQTVSVEGIASSDKPVIDLYLGGSSSSNFGNLIKEWTYVNRITTANGAITAYAMTKPTLDLPIVLQAHRNDNEGVASSDIPNVSVNNIYPDENGNIQTVSTFMATFSTSGWSSAAPYTQTVSCTGIKASDNPIVDVNLSSASTTDAADTLKEAWNLVDRITTGADTLTATCYDEKPTANVSVILKAVR